MHLKNHSDILISKTDNEYRYQQGDGYLQEKVLRKFMQGFMQLHILYHAKESPFYGSWMIDELKNHDYDISPGSLYPVLHQMASSGLLSKVDKNVDGKIRKYYNITPYGIEVLMETKNKAEELFHEMEEKS